MSECEHILFQGQLMLLDSDTMQPKHPIYLALLRNSLFLGHPTTGHISPKHPFHLVSFTQFDPRFFINLSISFPQNIGVELSIRFNCFGQC